MKKLQIVWLAVLIVLLAACGDTPPAPTNPQVNGFGIAENHVHSLITLPDANHTLVIATHYGIFRSTDHGTHWIQTAGGAGQPMQGAMTYQLSYNWLDPQRLYVLTYIQTTLNAPGDTLGLYTSGDGGRTWKLSIAKSSLTSNIGQIYMAQSGNDSSSEVYLYLNELGPLGLKVSMDNGQHFAPAGSPLPFANLLGLLPLPQQPGHLIAYGNNGIATSNDDGSHWQIVPGIQDSVYSMATGGPHEPIYASGDAGVYVSNDGGASFNLVYEQNYYGSLTVSPQNPQMLYGILAKGIYRSTDGGKSWSALPALTLDQHSVSGAVLSADPTNPGQVFLAISYPVEAYHFQSATNAWKSLTPPV